MASVWGDLNNFWFPDSYLRSLEFCPRLDTGIQLVFCLYTSQDILQSKEIFRRAISPSPGGLTAPWSPGMDILWTMSGVFCDMDTVHYIKAPFTWRQEDPSTGEILEGEENFRTPSR